MVSPYIKRKKTSNLAKRFRLTALRGNKQFNYVAEYVDAYRRDKVNTQRWLFANNVPTNLTIYSENLYHS